MTTKLINGVDMTEVECFEHCQNLIWSSIKKMIAIGQKVGVDKEDLFNEASIGLLKAYRGFDESKGFAFSTYAVPYIKGYAHKYIRDKAKTVRFGRPVIQLATRIHKEGCDDLSPQEIAEKLDEPIEKVNLALISRANIESIDRPVNDGEGKEITIADSLGSEADFSEIHVKEFISSLEERDQKLLELKLTGESQVSIAKKFKLSQPQVGRLLKAIGEKYKEYEEGKKMAFKAKGNLDKAKKLLKETQLPVGTIAKETNVSPSTLRYHADKIRSKKQEVAKRSEELEKVKQLQQKFEKVLMENKTLRTDNEKLRETINELENQPDPAPVVDQENWKRKHDLLLKYIAIDMRAEGAV